MKKLKVLTTVGTRPEIIRLSRVMAALDRHTMHIVVHTGQNYDYELNQVFFEDLQVRRPDHFLAAARGTPSETIGAVIESIDKVLRDEAPDAFLVLGDTNSCLAAIAAKRRKIPVFHMEAGNRAFDERVPEEINRRIVDHISDVNLTYSDIAREHLLREGFPPDRIIKTGSPLGEVLSFYSAQISASKCLAELSLVARSYYVVSIHREENIEDATRAQQVVDLLNWLAAERQLPVIVSTHPRTRKRIAELGCELHPLVQLLRPLGFFDYVHLQIHSAAVLSDSGSITEESSILNLPALNLRETHERPEGMEEAAVMMVGLDQRRVEQGLAILETQARDGARTLLPVADYLTPNVSEKVVRIMISYTDYISRTVWKKY